MSFEDASDLAKARAVVLFLGAGELAGGGGDGAFVVPRAAAVGLCKAFGVGLGEAAGKWSGHAHGTVEAYVWSMLAKAWGCPDGVAVGARFAHELAKAHGVKLR